MCMLCSENEIEREQYATRLLRFANRLEGLATVARNLASGTTKPHTGSREAQVKAILRELVEEWL